MMQFHYAIICPKDADRKANSVDPDLGSTLFAQTYLSENLGSLQFCKLLDYCWMLGHQNFKKLPTGPIITVL